MNNNDTKKVLCQMMEITYIQKYQDGTNNYNLFPINWFDIKNYDKKIEIIAEALNKNIKIINTNSYNDIIEGIKK